MKFCLLLNSLHSFNSQYIMKKKYKNFIFQIHEYWVWALYSYSFLYRQGALPLFFYFDGSSEQGAQDEKFRYFDLLKAFGYIYRVFQSYFFSRKWPILLYTCATCSELPSYIRPWPLLSYFDKTLYLIGIFQFFQK